MDQIHGLNVQTYLQNLPNYISILSPWNKPDPKLDHVIE